MCEPQKPPTFVGDFTDRMSEASRICDMKRCWSVLTRDVKMSVFCLTNQNPLSLLLVNEKLIVLVCPASFLRLFTEIAIGRCASILDNFSCLGHVIDHIIFEFMIGRMTEITHRQALNAWQRSFVCLLFILVISNGLHCLSSVCLLSYLAQKEWY
jgi:hypothetical protein